MNNNTPSTFRVSGDTATVSTFIDFVVGQQSTLELVLGPSGINPISVRGNLTLNSGNSLLIDGSNYAGGAGSINLIEFATGFGGLNGTSADFDNVNFTGFDCFTPTLVLDSVNDVWLLNLVAITKPPTGGRGQSTDPSSAN